MFWQIILLKHFVVVGLNFTFENAKTFCKHQDERQDLDSKFFYLVKLADELKAKKAEKYWTAGVIFEFCKLDISKDQ